MKEHERALVLERVKDLLANDLKYREGPQKGEHETEFMTRVYQTALEGIRAEEKKQAQVVKAESVKKGK